MSNHRHPKLTTELRNAARWLRAMADKNPRLKKQFDELADRDVAAASAIEILEHELETVMARTAAAIDKLESRLDESTVAIAARDRKIASQAALIATLQTNALDDADKADLDRVEGQTFDPIPPVTDDTATAGTGTATPPVTAA